MNRQALADELNFLLASESRSLLRHLEEAKPYLSARTFRVWATLGNLAHAGADHQERLSAILDRLELPTRPAGFASEVANYHFIDVQTLLPTLIAEEKAQVAAYERALRHASDGAQPAVAAELADLLAATRTQLESLETAAGTLAA